MSNTRKCCLSCPLFWGYTIDINLDNVECNEDIVKLITDSLHKVLTELNLVDLSLKLEDMIKTKKYHIHTDFGNVLLTPESDTIYVCNH